MAPATALASRTANPQTTHRRSRLQRLVGVFRAVRLVTLTMKHMKDLKRLGFTQTHFMLFMPFMVRLLVKSLPIVVVRRWR